MSLYTSPSALTPLLVDAQHYHTVHMSTSFTCTKCGKTFGLRDVCSRHEQECGRAFQCSTCEVTFHSRNALYQHAKRKRHTLPEGSKPRSKRDVHPTATPPSASVTPECLSAIIFRQLLQLPRLRHTQDIATQTDDSCPSTSMEQSTRYSPSTVYHFQGALAPDAATSMQPDYSDLATQTELLGLLQDASFQLNDVMSVTPMQDASDCHCDTFSQAVEETQTFPNSVYQRDDYSQTQSESGSYSQSTQTHTSRGESNLISQAIQTQSNVPPFTVSQAVQTYLEPDSCEFSTQTSTDYDDMLQASVDFGTQTADLTWPLSLLDTPLSPNLLPLECMDFGTQTLESALLAIPPFDFGGHSPVLGETRDQECQTPTRL